MQKKTSLLNIYQLQLMKNSTLVLPEIILDGFYRVIVNVILRFHSNSHCRHIHLYDDLWVIILIQFEVIEQHFPSY